MKNLKFLAMFFAAALTFAACEPAEEGGYGDGELVLKATPAIILCDGEYASTLVATIGGKKVTDGLSIFDDKNNPVELPDMKFTTTKEGVYTFWASYGDKISNEVTITAVVEFPAATELPLDPNPNSTSFARKVMLVQYTGTACPWCPFMTDCINEFPKSIANKCVLTAAHRFNQDDPAYLTGVALEQTMAVEGFPTLAVDMHSLSGYYNYPALVRGMVQEAIDREDAKVGIAACASYNDKSRMVAIKAEVKAAVTDNYRIGAWLLEDGIYGKQFNNGADGKENYDTHDNCIRIADSKVTSTDYTGYYLGEIKAGEKMVYEFNPTNMTLDASWKAENCHLVIFVTCEGARIEHTLNNWYVNNVVALPLNSSVAYQYK